MSSDVNSFCQNKLREKRLDFVNLIIEVKTPVEHCLGLIIATVKSSMKMEMLKNSVEKPNKIFCIFD